MTILTILVLVGVLGASIVTLWLALHRIRSPQWRTTTAWMLVAVLLASGWWASRAVNPYLRMAITWVCMFLAFKTLRLLLLPATALGDLTLRRFGGFMLWLGMDLEPWLKPPAHVAKTAQHLREGATLMVIGFSVALGFMVLPLNSDWWRLVRAWSAWVGIVIGLFFGVTRVWMGLWNAAGRDVKLLFNQPVFATSISNWWGDRWNMPVHTVLSQAIWRPLRRPLGVRTAALAVFLVSGVMHEYLLSYPAHGGWGLPIGYFVVQACAMTAEQQRPFRRWLSTHWWRGSIWTLSVALIPAPLLFHPALLHAIIMPLLR